MHPIITRCSGKNSSIIFHEYQRYTFLNFVKEGKQGINIWLMVKFAWVVLTVKSHYFRPLQLPEYQRGIRQARGSPENSL